MPLPTKTPQIAYWGSTPRVIPGELCKDRDDDFVCTQEKHHHGTHKATNLDGQVVHSWANNDSMRFSVGSMRH